KALTKQMLGKDAKTDFVTTTANTRIPLLKNGNVDAVLATMTITPERAKQVTFSKPYFPAGSSLLVPTNSKFKNVKDLEGKTVLAVKGTTAVDDVHKYAPKARILQYDDYGQAMSALKANQGVALTTDNGLLAGIAQENPGYKLVGGVYSNAPYGIAVNKGQKQMADHIDQALNELQKNGTYDRLIKGVIFALLEVAPSKFGQVIAKIYIAIFRNIPLLVIVMIFYLIVPRYIVKLSGFQAGTIGLTLYTSAFIAETVRAGINSIG